MEPVLVAHSRTCAVTVGISRSNINESGERCHAKEDEDPDDEMCLTQRAILRCCKRIKRNKYATSSRVHYELEFRNHPTHKRVHKRWRRRSLPNKPMVSRCALQSNNWIAYPAKFWISCEGCQQVIDLQQSSPLQPWTGPQDTERNVVDFCDADRCILVRAATVRTTRTWHQRHERHVVVRIHVHVAVRLRVHIVV